MMTPRPKQEKAGGTRQAAAQHGRWRTMEKAPRDGSSVLCLTEFGDYEIAVWDGVVSCWISKRGFLVSPAFWQRLPRPPHDFSPRAS